MKCTNCGFEIAEDFAFCPNCGTKYVAPQPVAEPQPVVVAEPVVQAIPTVETIPQASQPAPQPAMADHPLNRVLFLLKDPLFLVVCILISVSAAFTLFSASIPVIEGLLTIFCWLTYAKGRKNVISAQHLRCISGTVFAEYVIGYVLSGLLALCGVLFFGIAGMGSSYMLNEILEEADILCSFAYSDIPFAIFGVLFFIVCLIAAGIIFVINFFGVRKIHGFTKELYQSVQLGNLYLNHTRTVRTWLFVLAGFYAFGAFSSVTGFFADGSMAAAAILAGLLINKYLLTVD